MNIQKDYLPKFECKIKKEILSTMIKIMKSSSMDDGGIQVKQVGFQCKQMDNSHVTMIRAHLDVLSFESYYCRIEGLIKVDFEKFEIALRVFSDKDTLSISCDSDPFIVISSDKISMTYRLYDYLTDVDVKVPKLDYDDEFLFYNKTNFRNKLLLLNRAHDYVVFDVPVITTSLGDIRLVSKTNDEAKALSKLECTNTAKMIKSVKSFKVSYSIEYITGFLKHLPSEEFIFKSKKSYPAYMHSTLDHPHSWVEFWIAPRNVENPKDLEI